MRVVLDPISLPALQKIPLIRLWITAQPSSVEFLLWCCWGVEGIVTVPHQHRTLTFVLLVHGHHVVLEFLGKLNCHLDMVSFHREAALFVLCTLSLREADRDLEGCEMLAM
jgi:hypothetical protein